MGISKKLIRAVVQDLINNDRDKFIDRLYFFIKDKIEFLNYLADGVPEITDSVEEKIIKIIKNDLPIPDNFKKIENITITFSYSYEPQFCIEYKVLKYFKSMDSYDSDFIRDESHNIEVVTTQVKTINTDQLN